MYTTSTTRTFSRAVVLVVVVCAGFFLFISCSPATPVVTSAFQQQKQQQHAIRRAPPPQRQRLLSLRHIIGGGGGILGGRAADFNCATTATTTTTTTITTHFRRRQVVCLSAKKKKSGGKKGGGFGGGGGAGAGFGTSKQTKNKKKPPSKKAVMKKIEKTYGGTSPEQIAAATQRQVELAIKQLPPHYEMALQLYQQLQKWDARISQLSILEQTNIPSQELDGATRAREELQKLYDEHSLDDDILHNTLQQITWDASADAKYAKSLTGKMPSMIEQRIDRACDIVAETLADDDNETNGRARRCLDVGCGYGVLVPFLTKAGVSRNQIVGVDLSQKMIRCAEEQFSDVEFVASDFINEFEDKEGFDAIIFCSSLHDMPNVDAALRKASTLLMPNGKIVIVHPQGASHVLKQVSANPVLVKRGLPTTEELLSLEKDENLELIVEPAPPGSIQEEDVGYLAVLQKKQKIA